MLRGQLAGAFARRHRPPCAPAAAAAAGRASVRPSSVMRPCASMAPSSPSSALASLSAGSGGGSRNASLRRIADAPLRQVEHEGRQVGRQDFRPRIGLQRAGLRLVPQPVADARLGAPGAAAALVGGRARDPHGLQPRQTDIRLVARHARQAAVDHHAHAFDGERGFRDRGRQHHLAPARRRRRNGAVLLARIERAVERDDIDVGVGDALLEQRLGAADFGGARQEHQQRAGIRAQRRAAPRPPPGAQSARADRGRDSASPPESAAFAFDHRRIAEQRRHARAVERRRHHQEFEILAQALLRVARKRQPEIGIERALMEFVEQHGGDAIERGIVEHQPREHALGDHLDAGALATPSSRSARAGPTVSPTCSPSVDAMRAAAARAASRRGSSTRIFLSFAHGSSSSTSGTRVVLPAPGGATSTAALFARAARRSAAAARRRWEGVEVRIVDACRHTAHSRGSGNPA